MKEIERILFKIIKNSHFISTLGDSPPSRKEKEDMLENDCFKSLAIAQAKAIEQYVQERFLTEKEIIDSLTESHQKILDGKTVAHKLFDYYSYGIWLAQRKKGLL